MAVAFRTASTLVSGTATATSTIPTTGLTTGDVLVLVAESAAEDLWLSDSGTALNSTAGGPAAGWEQIPGFTGQSAGSGVDTSTTRIMAWWRRVTDAALAQPTIQADCDEGAQAGNHVAAYVLVFSGCEDAEDPFDPGGSALASDSDTSDTTSVTFPSITTTIDSAYVVNVCASPNDTLSAQFSGWTNANLTGYAELSDQFGTSGNGGGIGVAGGTLATAGSSGSSTATVTTNPTAGGADYQARLTFALIPPQTRSYTGFPVLESTTESTQNSNATTHSIALPATVNSGDLLIAVMTVDGSAAVTWDNSTAGTWTNLYDTVTSTVARQVVYYKVADGTEDGLSLSIGTGSEQSSARVLRFSGAQSVEAATPNTSGGGGGTNYPNLPSLTPSWGSAKTTWLAVLGTDDETNNVINYPNNYVGGETNGGGAGSGTMTATAIYRKEQASETPAAFITEQGEDWICCLLAIQPASTGPQEITANGYANTSAFGTSKLNQQAEASGHANTSAFGTATLSYAIRPSGHANTNAFGSPSLDQQVEATGHANSPAFGTAKLNQQAEANGFANTPAFGAPTAELQVNATGLANAPAFGTAQLDQQVVADGLANAQAFGTATLAESNKTVTADGYANTSAFGTAALEQQVNADGLANVQAFGTVQFDLAITADGLANTSQFGTARLDQALSAEGHANTSAFGTAQLDQRVEATGLANEPAFGTASLSVFLTIGATGLANTSLFGTATLRRVWEAVSQTPEAWSAQSATAETWSAIAAQSETWSAQSPTSETWADVPDTSETWN